MEVKTVEERRQSAEVAEGELIGFPSHDHGADSQLQRRLKTRHIFMIALGTSIGLGLWLGSGTNLANGGPAALFLGYLLAGSMVWAISHSIGEMAVLYPVPSAFVQWTNKFVDPAAGFALGWCYAFHFWITVANELQGVVTILGYWTDKVHPAVWISVFWVLIVMVNLGPVTLFAEIEFVASSIKFGWILVVVISFIVISAGGAPNHEAVGFRYWNEMAFTNGFKGFLSVLPICIFAMSGAETSGLVAAETANPRKSVPRAVNTMWMRLAFFYVLGALMITINISPKEKDLFGGAGSTSPFVIVYQNAGLKPLAHIMNAIILISAFSTGMAGVYGSSRTIVGLSEMNMAPKIAKKADSYGRPWAALAPPLLVGGGLAYLNLSNTSATVFGWFSHLNSLFILFNWSLISFSHIRMRKAWKVQGRDVRDLPWRSWTWPWGAYWGLSLSLLLIVLEFYLAVWPLNETQGAETFFANYVSVVVFVVIWSGAKCYFRGPLLVDCLKIDLDDGRRFYSEAQSFETQEKGTLNKLRGWLHLL